jgi:1,4-dihydroxy-2-naphthoate octaprenyltransferase
MRALSWLYVTRAPFLTATIVPVLVGALVAPWLVAGTDISVGRLLLTLLGASLAHLGANTANDYFDWRSGVDDMNTEYVVPYSGGSRMIQLGVISARGMLSTSLVLYAVAAGAGAYLATSIGIWPEVAGLAVAGAALGFLYTAPPLRLAARGLGELAILMAFGPLLVAGATLIQTGSLEPRALLVGLPTGILTGAIIWVNQFPDVPADSAGGKNTLVVRMGQMTSRWLYILLWALAYASVVGLVVSELLPVQALVGLLSMPLAIYVTVQLFRHFRSRAIRTAQAGTIYLHLVTGLLLALGVWLAI